MDNTNKEQSEDNRKIKHSVLKHIKGLTNLLKDSSKYWKGTISNLGKNFCQCNRIEVDHGVTNEETTKTDYEVRESGNLKANDTIINNKIDNDTNLPNDFVISKKIWTTEEDQRLIQLVTSNNSRNWKQISLSLPNKTPQQCAYRYTKLTQNMKKKFNRNDDITLIELTEIYGKNWEVISNHMEGWTPNEIEERYVKHLDPKLKRSKFEKEEDELIIQLHEKYGNKWGEIAKHFTDRNASMIKNRYYSFLKKKTKDNSNTLLSNTIGETISDSSSVNVMTKKNKGIFSVHKVEGRKTVSYHELNKFRLDFSTYSRPDSVLCESDYNYRDDMSEMISKLDDIKKDWSVISENAESDKKRNSNLLCNLLEDYRQDMYSVNVMSTPRGFMQNDYDLINPSRNNFDLNMNTDTIAQPDSPILNQEYGDDFSEQYNNVFKFRKQSYDDMNNNQFLYEYNSQVSNNIFNEENTKLSTQYRVLEETFHKVLEHNLSQMEGIKFRTGNSPETAKALKFLEFDMRLDEKRERLSKLLCSLKEEYVTNIINVNHIMYEERNVLIRSSLLKQIEIIVELINVTKLKINLLQQFQVEFNSTVE